MTGDDHHDFGVRFHGRGGQGVVTAAELLSVAAFLDGRHAQAFPSFGSERTGAPVVSYCRISDRQIRTRSPIDAPDALVIQDATLLHQVALFSGIGPEVYLLVNTSETFDQLGMGDFVTGFHADHLLTVPATEIAMKHLGRPLPNAVLLGGFAVMTGVVSLDSVNAAISDRFSPAVGEANCAAAREAARFVEEERYARAAAD